MKVLGMTDALTLPISFSTFRSRFSHQQRATLCFQIARPWQLYCSDTARLTTARFFLTLSRPGEWFLKVKIIRFPVEARRIDELR